MFVVIAYDVADSACSGKQRYQQLHKLCQRLGYAVNYSVFEFDMAYSDIMKLIHDIQKIINLEVDSVRIYFLGHRTDSNVLLLGKRRTVEMSDETFVL